MIINNINYDFSEIETFLKPIWIVSSFFQIFKYTCVIAKKLLQNIVCVTRIYLGIIQ